MLVSGTKYTQVDTYTHLVGSPFHYKATNAVSNIVRSYRWVGRLDTVYWLRRWCMLYHQWWRYHTGQSGGPPIYPPSYTSNHRQGWMNASQTDPHWSSLRCIFDPYNFECRLWRSYRYWCQTSVVGKERRIASESITVLQYIQKLIKVN